MVSVQSLRDEIKGLRESLSPDEIARRSLAIQQRVVRLEEFRRARTVALYFPFRGEVQTGYLAEAATGLHQRLVFPRIQGAELEFILGPSTFSAGPWGLKEPVSGNSVSLKEIDLMVLPGLAFDRRCFRLGWGRGFFDRVLQEYSGVCLGLAYDFQILPEISVRPGERALDMVVSEDLILRRLS